MNTFFLFGAVLQNANNGWCVATIDDFTIEFISGKHILRRSEECNWLTL